MHNSGNSRASLVADWAIGSLAFLAPSAPDSSGAFLLNGTGAFAPRREQPLWFLPELFSRFPLRPTLAGCAAETFVDGYELVPTATMLRRG